MLAAYSLRVVPQGPRQPANRRSTRAAARSALRAAPRPLRQQGPKAVRPAAALPPAGSGAGPQGGAKGPGEAPRLAALVGSVQKMQQGSGLTHLMLAAQFGTADTIRELLAQGEDPAATDPGGVTALMFAASRPSAEVVAALLEAPGTPVGAKCATGASALIMAACYCHRAEEEAVEVMRLLLAAGADVNDHDGGTPLMLAAVRNSPQAVQLLLAAGADVTMAVEGGGTALHMAVQGRAPAVVTQLLAAGADPNAKSKVEQQTPLHTAVALGVDMAIIRALLQAGARLTRDNLDRTPTDWAAGTGYTEALRLLRAADAWQQEHSEAIAGAKVLPPPEDLYEATSCIMEAADQEAPGRTRDWDVVAGMLASGAKLKTTGGFTALHLAVVCDNVEAVRKLVAAGADLEASTQAGLTPLHLAVIRAAFHDTDEESAELVRVLLAAGANANVRDSTRGLTNLINAAKWALPAVTEALLEGGADPGFRDHKGSPPLLYAGIMALVDRENAGERKAAVARALLAAGADANAANLDSLQNPLQMAAWFGHFSLARVLLEGGARVELGDSQHYTALMYAAKWLEKPESEAEQEQQLATLGVQKAAVARLLLEMGDPLSANAIKLAGIASSQGLFQVVAVLAEWTAEQASDEEYTDSDEDDMVSDKEDMDA